MTSVPCELYTLYADNGDPLLLYGTDGVWMFVWPTPYIALHRLAFARWSKVAVERFRGKRLSLNHPMCAATKRWALWLGIDLERKVI